MRPSYTLDVPRVGRTQVAVQAGLEIVHSAPVKTAAASKEIDAVCLLRRRRKSRFPINEEIRYKALVGRSAKPAGAGKTLNISSGGILFTTQEQLPIGRLMELSVIWPVVLDDMCPLKLVATGRVVRSDINKAAVKITRHEFRTRAMNSTDELPWRRGGKALPIAEGHVVRAASG